MKKLKYGIKLLIRKLTWNLIKYAWQQIQSSINKKW